VRLEGHAVIAPDPGLGSPPVTIVSPALKLVLAPVLLATTRGHRADQGGHPLRRALLDPPAPGARP
jgi:hypothetical protein